MAGSLPRRQQIGQKTIITREEYKRMLTEFEMEGFTAQKRFMEFRERKYAAG